MSDLSSMSDADLIKMYRSNDPSTMSDQDLMASYARQQAAQKTGPVDAALIGAGKTFTRIGQGVQGLLPGDHSALDAKVAEENRLYQPLQDAHPLATAVGEGAPSMALGPAGMAAQGALEYGTPEERATRAAAGFVGGKLGELGGKVVGRVLQPIRSATGDATQALFDKFNMQGLPGQITGSAPVQWMESTLAKLPGGGRIRDMMGAQQTGLNRAVLDTMGASGDAVTPEAVQAAKSSLGQTFSQIPGQTTVTVDRQLASDLLGVESNYYKNLSPDQRPVVKQYIDDILAHANQGGMPGDVYQVARSRISARAASTQDSELKNALTGVRKALDGAFDRSAPPDAVEAMQAARGQYRAAKTFEGLATPDGNVSPARVANAGKGLPGDPGDLAKLATKIKSLPDSGTAQRLFYQQLATGGAIGAGVGGYSGDPGKGLEAGAATFAGPWLASQLLTRAPVRNYITKGLLGVTPEVEKWLARAGSVPAGLLGMSSAR
jgi:hypothetical protein